LGRLASGASRNQCEKLLRLSSIEGFFHVGVHPRAIAAQRVHQEQFGRKCVRRSVCRAQTGHTFPQRASNVYLICHGVLNANKLGV
jgi:hypothetical protein